MFGILLVALIGKPVAREFAEADEAPEVIASDCSAR